MLVEKTPSPRLFSGDTLVLATHNKGKYEELAPLFRPYVSRLLMLSDVNQSEPPDETGQTFEQNATLKALAAARGSGFPAVADDSGLCVDALGGQPGVDSAAWAGEPRDYATAMKRINDALKEADRTARFVCCLVLAWPDGHTETCQGEEEGTVIWPPKGTHGFGYDPFFVRRGQFLTHGEMTPEQKSADSHRTRAIQMLLHRYFVKKHT